jgi:hypothetical protein
MPVRRRAIECDRPSTCESLELWIVDLSNSRKQLILSVPYSGEVYGLDWGRGW